MGDAIRSTTKRAWSRPRLVIELCGTFVVVECVCPVPHKFCLFYKGDSFHMPESIANPGINCGLMIDQFLQVLPICVAVCVDVCCPQLVLVMHDFFEFVLKVRKGP